MRRLVAVVVLPFLALAPSAVSAGHRGAPAKWADAFPSGARYEVVAYGGVRRGPCVRGSLTTADGGETRVGFCIGSRHPERGGAEALIGCPGDLLVYGLARRQRGKLVMLLADGTFVPVRTRAARRGFVSFVYAGGPIDGRLAWTTPSGAAIDAARPGRMTVDEACRSGGVFTGRVNVPVPEK